MWTPVICETGWKPDGYLRTGNASNKMDSVGNAAELGLGVDVFLNLQMQDGKSLLKHIQQDSELAKELLSIQSASYETLKQGFLAMADSNPEMVTSSKIKQVYFPVNDDYHQFSILSNSGLICELRERIDKLRFSEEQKQLRELKRTNVYSEWGYAEIYGVTTIGYGGTKPQNISFLNNQIYGEARLLLSVLPALEQRDFHFPKHDFFKESIRFQDIRESLEKLHYIFTSKKKSIIPRRNMEIGRDYHLEEILDIIILRVMALRQVVAAQYREETNQLEQYQQIWLCPGFETRREQENEWLKQLCKTIANWITTAYSKIVKKSITLGQAEKAYIQQVIETHREALR